MQVDGRNSSTADGAFDRHIQRRKASRSRSWRYSRKTTDSPIAETAAAVPKPLHTGCANSLEDLPSAEQPLCLCPQYRLLRGRAFLCRDLENRNNRRRRRERGSTVHRRRAFEAADAAVGRGAIVPPSRWPNRARPAVRPPPLPHSHGVPPQKHASPRRSQQGGNGSRPHLRKGRTSLAPFPRKAVSVVAQNGLRVSTIPRRALAHLRLKRRLRCFGQFVLFPRTLRVEQRERCRVDRWAVSQ